MTRLLISVCLIWLLVPGIVLAQGYIRLTGLPDASGDIQGLPTERFINNLYILAISLAAFLAVVRIIFAGLQYMLDDVVTKKSDAKRDIRQSLTGLLIVLAAALILTTINPELTNLNFLRTAEPIGGDFSNSVGNECDRSRSGTQCGCGQIYQKDDSLPSGYRCLESETTTISLTTEQKEAIDEVERAAIEAGDFETVANRFNISEFEGKSPDEKLEIIDRWADECEGPTEETETGKEFRTLEVPGFAVEYVCVNPGA